MIENKMRRAEIYPYLTHCNRFTPLNYLPRVIFGILTNNSLYCHKERAYLTFWANNNKNGLGFDDEKPY